jgi:myosin heavy subunit
MSNNFNNTLNTNKINKDLLKSILTHGLIVCCIILVGFFENRKIFSDIRGGQSQSVTRSENQQFNTEKSIVQANLVDHKMVQQAVKRQELQAADKVIREKKIQQQEQQLAQLTKMAEQEMLKAKQEVQKAKLDRDKLKKEQESLQQEANKLKNQSKELLSQQEKLEQLKRQYQQAQQAQKKNLEQSQTQLKSAANSLSNQSSVQANQSSNNKVSTDNHQQGSSGSSLSASSSTIQTELSKYHVKWTTEIVNNRKSTMFFPDNLMCSVKMKVLSSGHLASVKIERSSGNQAYDSFSEQAIYKSAPFEMPQDPLLNKELVDVDHVLEFLSTFNDQ